LTGERLIRILSLLSSRWGSSFGARELCAVAVDLTRTSGAGVMLLTEDKPQGSLCTTSEVSALIEELQYTLGEGPCVDAHVQGRVVAEPDLATPAVRRWPAFAPPALAGGAGAVFGFPVRIGAARFGALNLYREAAGPLTFDQHADAQVVADVMARTIVSLQAKAPPGAIAAELELEVRIPLLVHQAAGMVSVQLDVSVSDALIRLRAHAFRVDQRLAVVAEDVVDRRLRFEASPTD
jgi:hypothetical protein